jgi:hypothetical protein
MTLQEIRRELDAKLDQVENSIRNGWMNITQATKEIEEKIADYLKALAEENLDVELKKHGFE